MTYLIGQMLLCLLAAAFLGFLLGWFLRGIGCRERTDALRIELAEARDQARRWESQARERPSRPGTKGGTAAPMADPSPRPTGDPKAGVRAPRYTPSFPVEEIEGIGPGFGRRLAALGVSSTAALLRESGTEEGRARIAGACDIDEQTVGAWATMADLLRIPGVGGQWAELLWRAGVRGVENLSGESPAPLRIRMAEINDAEHRVPELPTLEDIEHWISEAEAISASGSGGGPYLPSYGIEAIEGIGAGFGKRLRGEGVRTTASLLALGASPSTVERLATLCDVPEETVRGWLTMADLLRVPGIGGQWAELLWRCDVDGVESLARQDPGGLVEAMERVNAEEHRVPELPDPERVRFWIEEAGRMVG